MIKDNLPCVQVNCLYRGQPHPGEHTYVAYEVNAGLKIVQPSLATRFRHSCPDWDYMTITLDGPEAIGCCCFTQVEEAKPFYEIQEQKLDKANENSSS